MSMRLYNGKPRLQLWGCHDLDRKFVIERSAIAYNVCLIQTGVGLNRCHSTKGNHPLPKHAFIEIVNRPSYNS